MYGRNDFIHCGQERIVGYQHFRICDDCNDPESDLYEEEEVLPSIENDVEIQPENAEVETEAHTTRPVGNEKEKSVSPEIKIEEEEVQMSTIPPSLRFSSSLSSSPSPPAAALKAKRYPNHPTTGGKTLPGYRLITQPIYQGRLLGQERVIKDEGNTTEYKEMPGADKPMELQIFNRVQEIDAMTLYSTPKCIRPLSAVEEEIEIKRETSTSKFQNQDHIHDEVQRGNENSTQRLPSIKKNQGQGILMAINEYQRRILAYQMEAVATPRARRGLTRQVAKRKRGKAENWNEDEMVESAERRRRVL